ncbi:MAG: metalloregulator ArsR/SmtB family transcription factor [Proteobacteria bacterium]|nr:metalloregulator ArsR/SmtB family transcription factor [Pseudomonadota bacterium]
MANAALRVPHNPVIDEFVALTKAAGDHLRASVLRVLHHDSFGVLELCHIFSIAQPALSHHLKVLHNAGLVARRREGNNIYYRRSPQKSHLLAEIFRTIDEANLAPAIAKSVEEVHEQRRQQSEAFFISNEDSLTTQQTLICPSSAYTNSIIELWQHLKTDTQAAIEVGPGDGEVLETLAGLFEQVVGIDSSRTMLDKSSAKVSNLNNVRLIERDFSRLPRIRKYNFVVAAMVVHHLPSPGRFFQQAFGVLKPGGGLVVAELCAHDNEWVQTACGDLWLGFDTDDLNNWAVKAGFTPDAAQFLAQKNGFRIQILSYTKD